MTIKHFMATAVVAVLLSTSASAQMFGDSDLDYDRFNAGLGESGMYNAWDRDGEVGINEREFATGMYADWDRDNNMQLTEEEFDLGSERWYGADRTVVFTDLDADASGMIEREEFGAGWDNEYYTGWDTDADGLLTEDEYGTGLYNTSDVNQDKVITIEEEGWFDGDDIEAEIEEVGDVM